MVKSQRLNSGCSPWLIASAAIALLGEPVAALIALAATAITSFAYGAYIGRMLQGLLDLRPEAFNSELVGMTYFERQGREAQLAMQLVSEAARAGEHGRGFSVVADEVRLADSALGEISLAIQEISDMSVRMASAVEEQSGVADHISEQITEIADTARQTQQTAEQTQHSSNELQNTSKQLYSLIERFNLKR